MTITTSLDTALFLLGTSCHACAASSSAQGCPAGGRGGAFRRSRTIISARSRLAFTTKVSSRASATCCCVVNERGGRVIGCLPAARHRPLLRPTIARPGTRRPRQSGRVYSRFIPAEQCRGRKWTAAPSAWTRRVSRQRPDDRRSIPRHRVDKEQPITGYRFALSRGSMVSGKQRKRCVMVPASSPPF
jgi:hypothetical protein